MKLDFDLDLNLLKIFNAVYDNKSILMASQKLFISQPAVTKSIKKLEEFLGAKLFLRLSKGVKPTLEGDEFFRATSLALTHIQQGINTIISYKNLEKGKLKIGSSSTIIRVLLVDFITNFSKKYPKLKIEIADGISTELLKSLNKNEIDLAILNAPIKNPSNFATTKITETHDCFITNYKNKLKFASRDTLKNLPIVVQKFTSSNRDGFEIMCKNNNFFIDPKYEMTSFGLITDFVEKGLGVGFTIKDFISKDLKNKRVKILETDLKIAPRDILAVTNLNKIQSKACEVFISELKKYFK